MSVPSLSLRRLVERELAGSKAASGSGETARRLPRALAEGVGTVDSAVALVGAVEVEAVALLLLASDRLDLCARRMD